MSRLQQYRYSINKFIKEKSILFSKTKNPTLFELYISQVIEEGGVTLPVLFLTVLNNLNKKKGIQMHGYYFASVVEFLLVLCHLGENRDYLMKKYGESNYILCINKIQIIIYQLVEKNIDSIRSTDNISSSGIIDIVLAVLSVISNGLHTVNNVSSFNPVVTKRECHHNVVQWYLRNNDELVKKFSALKQVKEDSIQEWIDTKYTSVCEVAIIIGWIVGGGDIKHLPTLKSAAKAFSVIYKLSIDFKDINTRIMSDDGHSLNYVVNFGLEAGYEKFLNNKQIFIEKALGLDIFSRTLREVIDDIEESIDFIIDQTSPDLKSSKSFSSQKTTATAESFESAQIYVNGSDMNNQSGPSMKLQE